MKTVLAISLSLILSYEGDFPLEARLRRTLKTIQGVEILSPDRDGDFHYGYNASGEKIVPNLILRLVVLESENAGYVASYVLSNISDQIQGHQVVIAHNGDRLVQLVVDAADQDIDEYRPVQAMADSFRALADSLAREKHRPSGKH